MNTSRFIEQAKCFPGKIFIGGFIIFSLSSFYFIAWNAQVASHVKVVTTQILQKPFAPLKSIRTQPHLHHRHRHIKILPQTEEMAKTKSGVQFIFVLSLDDSSWELMTEAWRTCSVCMIDKQVATLLERMSSIENSADIYTFLQNKLKERLLHLNEFYYGQHRFILMNPFGNASNASKDYNWLAFGASEVQVHLRFMVLNGNLQLVLKTPSPLLTARTFADRCHLVHYLNSQLPIFTSLSCHSTAPSDRKEFFYKYLSNFTGYSQFGQHIKTNLTSEVFGFSSSNNKFIDLKLVDDVSETKHLTIGDDTSDEAALILWPLGQCLDKLYSCNICSVRPDYIITNPENFQ